MAAFVFGWNGRTRNCERRADDRLAGTFGKHFIDAFGQVHWHSEGLSEVAMFIADGCAEGKLTCHAGQ